MSVEAKQRVSRHGGAALVVMLMPAVLFPTEMLLLHHRPGFEWLGRPQAYPWQLWAIAFCGMLATAGGIADWFIHRGGETAVGLKEHRAHVAALASGGVPLFALMSAASIVAHPERLLIPIIFVAGLTTVLVCYDEFRFHRRCGWVENVMHRLLTFGNAAAWVAWTHWCFVAGRAHG